METQNPTPSPKDSPSDDLTPLIRLQLAREGIDVQGMSDEQVNAEYGKWKAKRQEANDRDLAKRRREREENDERITRTRFLDRVLPILKSGGVDPAGMTDDQLRSEAVRITEENKRAVQERLDLEAKQERLRTCDARFEHSGIPERHKLNAASIDTGACPQWLKMRDLLAKRMAEKSGFLVAILGQRGTGKTQMAVSLIRAACDLDMRPRYTKALDLFRLIRSTYSRGGGDTEMAVTDRLAGYGLLIIDEAHQRGESDFENNTLINLLDRRYDAMKCTILIANQSKEDFARAVGESIVSRIHETGDALVCNWQSFRRPGSWLEQP